MIILKAVSTTRKYRYSYSEMRFEKHAGGYNNTKKFMIARITFFAIFRERISN